jgi:hypothetical protein
MDAYPLFAFEDDFVKTLRCVPMAVRFKLDACGVKLSLRQWSRFTLEDRRVLREAACETPQEVAAYRERLEDLIRHRAHDVAKPLSSSPDEAWRDPTRVPAGVVAYARSIGVSPPNAAAWARLSALQRFALIKLSRDNHDNVNFIPALREFGLLPATPDRVGAPPV